MNSRAVSWQECYHCGSVYILWSDPEAPERTPMGPMKPEDFLWPDGKVVDKRTDPAPCKCGAGTTSAELMMLFHPSARRWGEEARSRRRGGGEVAALEEPVTESELTCGRELVAKMTQAPWALTTYQGGVRFGGPLRMYAGTDYRHGEPLSVPAKNDDLEGLVWLRNHAMALFDHIKTLTTQRDELQARVMHLESGIGRLAEVIEHIGVTVQKG